MASGAQGIATDGTTVFYAFNSGIRSVPAGGGAVTTVAFDMVALSVAVDSTNVYWTDVADRVMSAPKNQMNGAGTAPASGQPGASCLAVDATNLYWLAGNEVRMAPKATGTPVTTLASGLMIQGCLTTDAPTVTSNATTVFFTDPGSGTIRRVPVASPLSVTVMNQSPVAGPFGIGVSNTFGLVYFTSSDANGSIQSLPVGASAAAPATVHTGQGNPHALVVSGKTLWWIDQAGGAVVTGGDPNNGGPPAMTLAGGQVRPIGLAVGPQPAQTPVVWTDNGNGTVHGAPPRRSPVPVD
jgi:hypothetical protein